MEIVDTGGRISYLINNCDCGSTGGCDKCRPKYAFPEIRYIFPESPAHLPRVEGVTVSLRRNQPQHLIR